jgi:hypothetical protein
VSGAPAATRDGTHVALVNLHPQHQLQSNSDLRYAPDKKDEESIGFLVRE